MYIRKNYRKTKNRKFNFIQGLITSTFIIIIIDYYYYCFYNLIHIIKSVRVDRHDMKCFWHEQIIELWTWGIFLWCVYDFSLKCSIIWENLKIYLNPFFLFELPNLPKVNGTKKCLFKQKANKSHDLCA